MARLRGGASALEAEKLAEQPKKYRQPHLARKILLAERLELALKYHITDFRAGSGTRGRITTVRHIKRGWISLPEYYDMQKAHELMPIWEKIVEGGYRLKAQIFGSTIEVGVSGYGVEIPVGLAIIIGTAASAKALFDAGKQMEAMTLLALLVLPFGEIVLLYLFADSLFKAAQSEPRKSITDQLSPLFPVIEGWQRDGPAGAAEAATKWVSDHGGGPLLARVAASLGSLQGGGAGAP